MAAFTWTLRGFRDELTAESLTPTQLAEFAIANSNRNVGRNTYIWQDVEWTRAEAARVEATPRGAGGPFGDGRSALWGLPISVKDCFDLAGSPTTCGIHFYRDRNGQAEQDSWLVEQLRAAGAVIVGKTHLHPLAYELPERTPSTGIARSLAIPVRSPAAPRAAPLPACRRVLRWQPSVPTPAVRCVRPPRFAVWPVIAPRWAAAIGAVARILPNRSIRWAGFFGILRTPRCLLRRSRRPKSLPPAV